MARYFLCYVKLSRKKPDFEKLSRRACAGTWTLYSSLYRSSDDMNLYYNSYFMLWYYNQGKLFSALSNNLDIFLEFWPKCFWFSFTFLVVTICWHNILEWHIFAHFLKSEKWLELVHMHFPATLLWWKKMKKSPIFHSTLIIN